jgi:hypothetical protein
MAVTGFHLLDRYKHLFVARDEDLLRMPSYQGDRVCVEIGRRLFYRWILPDAMRNTSGVVPITYDQYYGFLKSFVETFRIKEPSSRQTFLDRGCFALRVFDIILFVNCVRSAFQEFSWATSNIKVSPAIVNAMLFAHGDGMITRPSHDVNDTRIIRDRFSTKRRRFFENRFER